MPCDAEERRDDAKLRHGDGGSRSFLPPDDTVARFIARTTVECLVPLTVDDLTVIDDIVRAFGQ